MKFESYLNESFNKNKFLDALKKISRYPFDRVKKIFKSSWEEFLDIIKKQGVEDEVLKVLNRNFGTNYRSLQSIPLNESVLLNEDFKHYWEFIKDQAFPALSFWPMLQVWLDIDKILRGSSVDMSVTSVYAVMWFSLVSGKFIGAWNQWKRNNPDQWEKEGSSKNPFKIKKD